MSGWPAEASGTAKPVDLPAHTRRITARECAGAREGVQLMVTTHVQRRVVSWGWSLNDALFHQPVPVLPGIEWPTSPERFEVDVVIVREGRSLLPIEVRALRKRTPLPFAPFSADSKQDDCVRATGTVLAEGSNLGLRTELHKSLRLNAGDPTLRTWLADRVGLHVEIDGELGFRAESLDVYRVDGTSPRIKG